MKSPLEDLDVSDLLSHEGVEFKVSAGRSGTQLNLKCCPVCGDEKWRTYLNADTGIGNCFRCGEGLNKFKFIKAHLGLEDNRAVFQHAEAVLKHFGWQPPKKGTAVVEDEKEGEVIMPLSYKLPTAEGLNATYLEQRGVTGKYAAMFELMYCDSGYYRYKDDKGELRRQVFDERIIVPVHDHNGKLVTFQGRDITGTAERKYLFPPRLPGTGRFLYNAHRVVAEGATHVIVNEGAFDVIATKIALDKFPQEAAGIGVVGTFGKHLSENSFDTKDQLSAFLKLKATGVTRVTIMWDGEASALEAAVDAAGVLHRVGFEVFIAFLPRGKDPNEVPAETVMHSIRLARPYTKMLAAKIKLSNPYKKPIVSQS